MMNVRELSSALTAVIIISLVLLASCANQGVSEGDTGITEPGSTPQSELSTGDNSMNSGGEVPIADPVGKARDIVEVDGAGKITVSGLKVEGHKLSFVMKNMTDSEFFYNHSFRIMKEGCKEVELPLKVGFKDIAIIFEARQEVPVSVDLDECLVKIEPGKYIFEKSLHEEINEDKAEKFYISFAFSIE